VKKITSDTAKIWGLKDRGELRPGYAADVVVFDADRIGRGPERPAFDMPGEGMRYVRDATGVEAVMVNGEMAWEAGRYAEAKSGVICELA
jgi:N-acyl-D-amino-acid deacylase